MKNIAKLLALTFLLGIAGCIEIEIKLIYSLHPLYTDNDLIFEPALLGVWGNEDSFTETLTTIFIKEGEKRYKLIFIDDDSTKGEFVAHLVKIKDTSFLDIYPDQKANLKLNVMYGFTLLPVHSFFLVSQIDTTLQMSFIDIDWLEKLLEKKPNAIRHEKVDNGIVLTASSKELQKFLSKHFKTEGAFSELSELKRMKGE
jgi:hypothetical protein